MIIINFAHELTEAQLDTIKQLTSQPISQTISCPVAVNNLQPLQPQVEELLDSIELSQTDWESGILINPPGYAPVASILLASIHGRIGHFPSMIQIRPVKDSTPTQYEVAAILNLQQVRENARSNRSI